VNTKTQTKQLLEALLPQYFDSVTTSIRNALYEIDPTWKKGQFDVFSKHFHANLFRSFFTRRYSIREAKVAVMPDYQILEIIRQASQSFDGNQKAVFYGDLLSEYILLCPREHLPLWIESKKDSPNWLIVWHLHSTLWLNFYY